MLEKIDKMIAAIAIFAGAIFAAGCFIAFVNPQVFAGTRAHAEGLTSEAEQSSLQWAAEQVQSGMLPQAAAKDVVRSAALSYSPDPVVNTCIRQTAPNLIYPGSYRFKYAEYGNESSGGENFRMLWVTASVKKNFTDEPVTIKTACYYDVKLGWLVDNFDVLHRNLDTYFR